MLCCGPRSWEHSRQLNIQTQIKGIRNSYKDLRVCSEKGSHWRLLPVPKIVARARKAREKAFLAIQSVLIRKQISGWFSQHLLLCAELNFAPAKESDAGPKPSGTEKTEQETIVSSWQASQQTLAVQPWLHTGSYSNHKQKGKKMVHHQHTHLFTFSGFCFWRLVEKSKQQPKSGLRNMSLSQSMYFCNATGCRCLTTLQMLGTTG